MNRNRHNNKAATAATDTLRCRFVNHIVLLVPECPFHDIQADDRFPVKIDGRRLNAYGTVVAAAHKRFCYLAGFIFVCIQQICTFIVRVSVAYMDVQIGRASWREIV